MEVDCNEFELEWSFQQKLKQRIGTRRKPQRFHVNNLSRASSVCKVSRVCECVRVSGGRETDSSHVFFCGSRVFFIHFPLKLKSMDVKFHFIIHLSTWRPFHSFAFRFVFKQTVTSNTIPWLASPTGGTWLDYLNLKQSSQLVEPMSHPSQCKRDRFVIKPLLSSDILGMWPRHGNRGDSLSLSFWWGTKI